MSVGLGTRCFIIRRILWANNDMFMLGGGGGEGG